MQGLIQQFGNASELKRYPLTKSLQELKDLDERMTKYIVEVVNEWPVTKLNWADQVQPLRQMVDEFNVKLTEVQSYKSIVDRHKSGFSKGLLMTKRIDRGIRDKFRGSFEEKDAAVLSCIAMVAGDLIYAWTREPDEITYSVPGNIHELKAESLLQDNIFEHPLFLRPLRDTKDVDVTYFHHECARVITSYQAAVDAKAEECGAAMKRAKQFTSKGCIDTEQPLVYNDPNTLERDWLFDTPDDVKLMIDVQAERHVDTTLTAYPWRMHAGFHHVFAGRCVMTIVPQQTLLDFPNVEAWLADAPSTAARKFSSFFVYPGCSVWVPYGSMPVILGVPQAMMPEKESSDRVQVPKFDEIENENIVVGISLCYNTKVLAGKDDVNSAVKCLWVQACPHLYRNIKLNPKIQAWVNALIPEAGAPEDDA